MEESSKETFLDMASSCHRLAHRLDTNLGDDFPTVVNEACKYLLYCRKDFLQFLTRCMQTEAENYKAAAETGRLALSPFSWVFLDGR